MIKDVVSFIIPVYNSEKYINKCLNSCLNQTYKYTEFIIVNDGSTDSSAELLNEIAKEENRLRIIHTKNKGVTQARITGLDHATGKWIFFLDSDDTIENETIELLLRKAYEENSDLVIGNFNYVDDENHLIRKHKNIQNYKDFIKNALNFNITANLWGRLIKREVLAGIHWPSRDIKIGEDIISGLQIIQNSKNPILLDQCIYNYIQYENSTMNSKKPETIESIILYLKWLDSNFRNVNYNQDLDYFIMNEYYAYLRYGGKKYSINFINNIYDNIDKNKLHIKIKLALSPIGKLFIRIISLIK